MVIVWASIWIIKTAKSPKGGVVWIGVKKVLEGRIRGRRWKSIDEINNAKKYIIPMGGRYRSMSHNVECKFDNMPMLAFGGV